MDFERVNMDDITEEETYQEIEDVYGFYPVTFGYLPRNMKFQNATFNELLRQIFLIYQGQGGQQMVCNIFLNYNEHARGIDMEDGVIGTSSIQLPETTIMLKEQEIAGDPSPRWTAEFTYQNAHYIYIMSGIEEEEVEKIVKNLSFS